MEAPPNPNATAQTIESNENKMSCRVATSPRQLLAVLPLPGAAELLSSGFYAHAKTSTVAVSLCMGRRNRANRRISAIQQSDFYAVLQSQTFQRFIEGE